MPTGVFSAATKYPELSKCTIEIRHASLQAAAVVSILIQQERHSLEGAKELYGNVSRGFPPSLASLAGADDKQLTNTPAVWLGGVIMDKWTLGEADKPTVAVMARSAWTSAIMVGRMLQAK